MDRLADKFDLASLSLSLQFGFKICLPCDLIITSKEARNNVSVNAMETLKKPDAIAEKKANVKPVSTYTKNYEII